MELRKRRTVNWPRTLSVISHQPSEDVHGASVRGTRRVRITRSLRLAELSVASFERRGGHAHLARWRRPAIGRAVGSCVHSGGAAHCCVGVCFMWRRLGRIAGSGVYIVGGGGGRGGLGGGEQGGRGKPPPPG